MSRMNNGVDRVYPIDYMYQQMQKKDDLIDQNLYEIYGKLDDNAAQLAEKAKQHWVDVTNNGVKGDGVADDTTSIQSIINSSDRKTVYFPKGVYCISAPLTITNEVCLLLDSEAEIKATVPMTELLKYNISYTQSLKRFIKGGIWNGNGKADICLNFIGFAGLDVGSMVVKNPLLKGMYFGSDGIPTGTSFEMLASDIALINTLPFSTNPNVIGIHINTSDSNYEKISMKDFTKAMVVNQGGNNIRAIHPWISQTDRLQTSVGIENHAVANFINNCYLDTVFTGIVANHRSNITNCIFNFSESSRSLVTGEPVYIRQDKDMDFTYVENCYFEFINKAGETYTVSVLGGFTNRVKFVNCDYGLPNTYLVNRPVDYLDRITYKRVRINAYGLQAVPANGTKTYTFTITNSDISFGLGDTVIFNMRGAYETGLISNLVVSGTNMVTLKLNNITGSPITPADRVLYATLVLGVTEVNATLTISQS